MTKLTISGSIYLGRAVCLHCSEVIYFKLQSKKCNTCGAFYTKENLNIDTKHNIEVVFNFDGFTCLYGNCIDVCPSSNMFCENHSSEEEIERQKDRIKHSESKVVDELKMLDMLERSRKTWLIMKLSNIDEENSISKK